MPTKAQHLAKVTRERPDVGARGALDYDTDIDDRGSTREFAGLDAGDSHGARRQLDALTRPNKGVGTLATDLDRRDRRRNLQDLATELTHRSANRSFGQSGCGRAGDELSVGVIGSRRLAQPDARLVTLLAEIQVIEQPGRTADSEHEHAGSHGVERSCVTNPAGVRQATQLADDVVGGTPARLVGEDKGSGDGV